MPEISVFISYRRADTSADAGRLYDALRRRMGRDNLFMDVDSLRPGEDWVEAVEEAVSQSDVLLALIGPDWTDIRDEEGNRRLEDEFDRVRLEIEAALKADKPVIPVLFERTSMPHATDLPVSLRSLLRRHAIRISHATFDGDLRGLLRALRIIERAKELPAEHADRRETAPLAPPEAPPAREPAPAPAREPAPPAPEPARESAPKPAPPPAPSPRAPVMPPFPPPPPPMTSPGPTYLAAPLPPPPPPPGFYPAGPPPPQSGPFRGAVPVGAPADQGRGQGLDRRLLFIGAGIVGAAVVAFGVWAVLAGAPPATPRPTATAATTLPTSSPVTATLVATQTPTETATATPTDTPTQGGVTLDVAQEPAHGEVDLTSGFTPDPHGAEVTGGGTVNVSYLGGLCVGYALPAPDFRVQYTAGAISFLRFYFVGTDDPTLIVHDPSGSWACGDDSFETNNPTVDFDEPVGGQYDVWIASYHASGFPSGTLHVTELSSNHP